MALFKSGDPVIDQYNNYTTEQVIQIVTDKKDSYSPAVVDAARRILLSRGHDYRTEAQKAAEKPLNATPVTPQPRLQPNYQNKPSGGSGFKAWHWIWIIFIIIRMIGCLMKHR